MEREVLQSEVVSLSLFSNSILFFFIFIFLLPLIHSETQGQGLVQLKNQGSWRSKEDSVTTRSTGRLRLHLLLGPPANSTIIILIINHTTRTRISMIPIITLSPSPSPSPSPTTTTTPNLTTTQLTLMAAVVLAMAQVIMCLFLDEKGVGIIQTEEFLQV